MKRGCAAGTRQRGVALVTVLLVFALAATLAAAMLERAHLNQRAVANLVGTRQAWHYALGGEAYARQLLALDVVRGEAGIDTLADPWAGTVEVPVELGDGKSVEGELAIRVYDLQSRFNLNNVVDAQAVPVPAAVAALRRLLAASGAPAGLAAQWQDWIDADQATGEGGAEDADYVGFRTPGAPEADISALRLLRDMSADDYERLAPHVATLPPGTRININTAGVEVLQSLSPIIDAGLANRIVARQKRDGFRSVEAFLAFAGRVGDEGLAERVSVGSDYFEVVVTARHGDYWLRLRTHLRRDATNGALTVLTRHRIPLDEVLHEDDATARVAVRS